MKQNKKIRVANVIMEGRYGGPQARITAVAEKLKYVGIETIVVFPKKDSDPFYKKLSEKNIQTRRLSLHRLTKQKSHFAKFIAFFVSELFSLYKLFKKERVNIVHCNGSWQIKGIIAGKLSGAKIVWFLNDTQMPKLLRMIFRILTLICCDAVIANGNRAKKYYLDDLRLLTIPYEVIQSPVDPSIFDPGKVKEDSKIAGYPGLKIVMVSNINPIKGVEYFIEMASIPNKQHSDLNFFVVGSHLASQRTYSENMSQMVKNLGLKNLHFYGPSDNVPSVLKAADICVCSSIAEASPISVWEAMSMAKPIVSTDVGDVARFVNNGENGFVVPIKDSVALAEKVSLLVENAGLREKLAQKVRDVAVRNLDVNICAVRHAQFYREIMRKI
ncbi:MAG: glycosyltransferase family 4 protein [Deltaproteobacteria bacterium]|nr:glycosyltransferase family 4 protein [Deltaproteobacteria bacterium]